MTAYSMRKPKDWQAFERAIRALVACVLGDQTSITFVDGRADR
jgi:hypothetical protein